MILGLILGAAWFALFFLGHIVILRLVSVTARPRANQVMFLVGLTGTPATLLLLMADVQNPVLTQGGPVFGTLCGILLYDGLFILYMPFYYVVVASLSVSTIVLLGRQPNGALPITALREVFVSRRLVGQRLDTMVNNGFLRATPRGYELTIKGKRVAQVFEFIKQFWKLGAGG